MAAGGLDFGQIGCLRRQTADLLQRHVQLCLVGDGRHVQRHVGGAAHAQSHPDRQLQHLLGDDVPGPDVFLHQANHRHAALLGHPVLLAADRVGAGAARHRQAHGLRDDGHGIGRSHHSAGAGGRGHQPLHVLILLPGDLSAGQLSRHLLQLIGAVLLPLVYGRHHGAAGDEHGGEVDAQCRHNHGRHNLIAAADEHQAVQLVAAGIDLDGVGDHLAAGQHAAHSHMALGKAVAEGDGVHLKGDASRLPHAVLDQLADAVEVDVPGMHLVIGIDDADKRLGQLLVDQTHAPQMGPGARHAQAVHYLGAWVLWVLINQIHRFTHANLPPSSLFFDTRMG